MSFTTAKPGDTLLKEGVVGARAFLIRTGRADVFVDGEPVAQLGPGSVIGDPSARRCPAAATVRAVTAMELVELDARP